MDKRGFDDARDAIADDRDAIADDRDGIADDREAVADAREAAWARWETESHGIVAAADRRDQAADARDLDASRRDMAADVPGTVTSDDAESVEAVEARKLARRDRGYAKGNRIASAIDRFKLAFLTPASAERRAAAKQRIAAAEARSTADDERRQASATAAKRGSSVAEPSAEA